MSNGKTILITGGAGFIGSHISKKLIDSNYNVIIVDNLNPYYDPGLKDARIRELLRDYRFKLYRTDICDFKSMRKIFEKNKINIICHEAAQAGVRYSLENPFVYEEANLKGTLNLLELAKDFKINGFIFASSSSVYGANKKIPFSEDDVTDFPVSLYGATKKATELLVYGYHHIYGINATGLRYFTVYGPWGRPDMALFKFTKNILEGRPIEVYGHGRMERDFTYISDIVDGTIKAIEKNYHWEIFNLGYGKPQKLTHFIEIIEDYLGKNAERKYLPMQLGDVRRTYADISKARKLLKWKPKVPIEDGIRNFIDWYGGYYGI
ncbi:MAG TPA: NAD-dependent epimerase/dehydratase family protein [Candidatus Altiarchaeales archaeon]|nr:NAD-dependent epimerase/dehydratase family protein [Candidatus Altiarchaeales archaeon]